jgi:signal transduction histidine kinase
MLNKNINFDIDICKSIYVFADIDSIKIILRNVLDNAIKFSKEDGKIAIYIRSSEDEFHHLVIKDSGLGMKETTRIKLLKETLLLSKKENNEAFGSGLGLFLCKEVISKNDGQLDIESTIDVGTKIILMLPKFVQNG